jgi:hypothetical protein
VGPGAAPLPDGGPKPLRVGQPMGGGEHGQPHGFRWADTSLLRR